MSRLLWEANVSEVLWVLQIILALVMLGSGLAKGLMSREQLRQSGQTGAATQPLPTIRFIAVSELLGAVGIVLPWATGVAPWLTPLAALGFAIVMGLAFPIHQALMRQATTPEQAKKELGNSLTNLALLAVSVVVVIGRGLELMSV
jgi:hypothetical protein